MKQKRKPPAADSISVGAKNFPGPRWITKAVFIFLAVAVLGFGGRQFQRQERVATYLPPRPDLTGRPAELVARLVSAEDQARRYWRPLAGLAELAALYHANGFSHEATTAYRGLIALAPGEPRWPYLLATLHAGYGQLDEALPLFERAVVLAPNYIPAQLRLGDALLKTNQAAKASAAYSAVLQREPKNPYALLGLARGELADGKWEAARTHLEQAVAAQPDFAGGWALLATVYEHFRAGEQAALARKRATGRHRDPVDPWVDALINFNYDPYQISVAAATAGLGGDKATARKGFERAVALAPDDAAMRRLLGKFFAEQGESGAARVQFERAVALAPTNADGWLFLLQTLDALGDSAAAERALTEGLAQCPTSPGLHYERGRRLAAARNLPAAIVEFQEAKRLRPQEANAYIDLGVVYLRLGRIEEGLAEFRAAHAAEPAHPMPVMTLARYALETGDAVAARHWIAQLRSMTGSLSDDVEKLSALYRDQFGRAP